MEIKFNLWKKLLSVFFRNRQRETFFMLAKQVISEEMLYKSNSTVNNYLTALRSFMAFTGEDFAFSSINQQLMEHYQQHLKQKGVCLNTISCYMRSLCTIYNKVSSKKNLLPLNILFTMYSWERPKHRNAPSQMRKYCAYSNYGCRTTLI